MAERPQDERIVREAIDALKALPPVDEAAVARIVAAAAQERAHDTDPETDDLLVAHPTGGLLRRVGAGRLLLAGAGLAAAAALVGFLVGSGRHRSELRGAVVPGLSPPTAGSAVEVSAPPGDAASIPTQFVYESRSAKQVLLVGDFSGWATRAIPLKREGDSSLWETTIPLSPGRHVYAYLVDSAWTVDPRAPVARDPDFGVTGSVVIVGKP